VVFHVGVLPKTGGDGGNGVHKRRNGVNGGETEKASSFADGLSAVCAARSAVGCAGLRTGAQTAGMAMFSMPYAVLLAKGFSVSSLRSLRFSVCELRYLRYLRPPQGPTGPPFGLPRPY